MAADLPLSYTTSDQRVVSFFDTYWQKQLEYPANDFDAVVGYFTKRQFDRQAAISIAQLIISQAKVDSVPVFKIIDTLQGLTEAQLTRTVTEILNFRRDKTSRLGYKTNSQTDKFETRNILI